MDSVKISEERLNNLVESKLTFDIFKEVIKGLKFRGHDTISINDILNLLQEAVNEIKEEDIK